MSGTVHDECRLVEVFLRSRGRQGEDAQIGMNASACAVSLPRGFLLAQALLSVLGESALDELALAIGHMERTAACPACQPLTPLLYRATEELCGAARAYLLARFPPERPEPTTPGATP